MRGRSVLDGKTGAGACAAAGDLTRRPFKRAPQAERRHDLIQATMDCVRDLGLQATTVRNVAARAGVTGGLIRHYFSTKDHMIEEAYRETVVRITAAKSVFEDVADTAAARMRIFIAANLTAPVLDDRTLSLWASFISLIHVDDKMAAIHRDGYIDFRKVVEKLVLALFAEAGRPISGAECERYAIKINAILDGLWLEGCLVGDLFEAGELTEIGIEAVQSVLGIQLGDTL